jgi:hypothetical protein
MLPLQHKPPYCNICLGTVPKCVEGVPNLLHFPHCPSSKRSLYSVFRSPRLLATAVRQFLFLFPSFVRSQLCSPLPLQMPPFESCGTVVAARAHSHRRPPAKCGQRHGLTGHTSSSGPNRHYRPCLGDAAATTCRGHLQGNPLRIHRICK